MFLRQLNYAKLESSYFCLYFYHMQSSFVRYACTGSILLRVENWNTKRKSQWCAGLSSTEMKSTNIRIGEGTIIDLNPRVFPC